MAFADACARRVLAAAAVGMGLAACAPGTDIPAPDTAFEIPSEAVLPGRVSATGAADLAVDIGLARPVTVALAGVTAVDCVSRGATAYTSGLAELAPVGTEVTLVRSNGPAEQGHDLTAFVHATRPDRPAEASVNEVLVRTGRARLDPPVDHSAAAAPVRDQAAADSAALPEPDRGYRDALAAAEDEAWQARSGLIGECATRQEALDRDSAPPPPEPTAPTEETPVPPRIEITVQRPGVDITVRPSPRPRPCEIIDRC